MYSPSQPGLLEAAREVLRPMIESLEGREILFDDHVLELARVKFVKVDEEGFRIVATRIKFIDTNRGLMFAPGHEPTGPLVISGNWSYWYLYRSGIKPMMSACIVFLDLKLVAAVKTALERGAAPREIFALVFPHEDSMNQNRHENRPRQGDAASGLSGKEDGGDCQRTAITIERLAGAVPGESRAGQTGPERARREQEALVQYAQEFSKILPSSYLDGLFKTNEPSSEHDVFFRRSDQRVVKVTKPGFYGFTVIGQDGERIRATPVEYFQRTALYNRVFDDDMQFEGVVFLGPQKFPCIVVSQPFVVAQSKTLPYPLLEEDIAEYMQRLGFAKILRAEVAWRRESDGVECYDCHTKNFIMTKKGVVPIDLILPNTSTGRSAPAPVWVRNLMEWSRAQPLPPLKDVLEQFRASPEPYKSNK